MSYYVGECGCRHYADESGAIFIGECCEPEPGELSAGSDVREPEAVGHG